tara:strand:- start:6626 stop:7651 length:1026 start_codon:yes stop_codon:yes gene_type:complete
MAISNELLSSTLFSIRDGEVDELFQKVAFLDHCKRAGGIETEDGGIKIQRPLAVAEHSSITAFPTGYEPLSLAVNDVMEPAIYSWADFGAPIVITKKEELENQSEKAIVKIVEARMRSVMGMLRREINTQILAGNSSVLGDLNSLNGVPAAYTTGILEQGAPAPATQTNTIGGIQKSVVDVQGWYNRQFNAAGAFGTNGMRGMHQMWTETNSRSPMGEIDCVLMSEAGFANYKRALFAQERYIDEKSLDGGRMALMFAGAPVEADLAMPDASVNGAGNAATAYFLNFDGIKLISHPDADFAVSDFENISGTTARAATLYWKGQLIADHIGSQALLFNGEAY